MRLDHLLSKEHYTSANVVLWHCVGGVSLVESTSVVLLGVLEDLWKLLLVLAVVGALLGV